ncbi:MAG: VanZ family protein, partial [Eggerthella lenta]
MNVYVSNILFAALSFPLIAFFITLPYMIYQYRRFGSIPWLRTLVVYSFAFYLLCAYFLVLLPLPEDRSAVVPYAQTPQLVPFNFVHGFLAETTFSPSDPSTWLAALRDPYVYEAFFNVLLLVPLGMYLRYYFRRTWWQTLAIGFLVTLSFETTQLTGLWGLYEHPYRLFDVDDLMLNTLGAMIGFWTVGPAMRVLPDIRLVNEEAREAGMRASVTKRALSFFIDLAIALAAAGAATAATEALGARAAVEAAGASWGTAVQVADAVSFAAFFALVPALTRGQTLAQKLLRLRIVRTDATPARWYQYLARYGLLALFGWAPFSLLFGVLDLDAAQVGEMNALAAFAAEHRAAVVGAWTAFMTAWAVSLAVRAARAGARKRPFVMLNGVLSGTRVMTEAGVELARERRGVLDVDEVAALERAVAEDGTPLAELMDRAGRAVADEVRAWVPDPAPVVVLSGSGNNGGDGWVAARVLAEAGYPVTLVAPDLAERLHAEPARSTALETFARAAEDCLPLSVLIAPDADVLADAVDEAEAVV